MSDSTTTPPSRPGGLDALKAHVIANKIDCGMWAIRVLAIIFAIGYFIPIFIDSQSAYYKVLLANAAVSALRLHQHLGRVQLSRQFISELFMEDSGHYLFYSLIFIYVAPATLVLLPVVLFCILHASSYSLTLLDTMGQNSWWGCRLLILVVEHLYLNILRFIALSEIILMPFTVILVLFGKAGVFTPMLYYKFLVQRYASRRNPYTRNMFRELRLFFENLANKPKVPQFAKSFIASSIALVSKLGPEVVAQTPPPQQ